MPPGIDIDGFNITVVVYVSDILGSTAVTSLGATGAPLTIVSNPPEQVCQRQAFVMHADPAATIPQWSIWWLKLTIAPRKNGCKDPHGQNVIAAKHAPQKTLVQLSPTCSRLRKRATVDFNNMYRTPPVHLRRNKQVIAAVLLDASAFL